MPAKHACVVMFAIGISIYKFRYRRKDSITAKIGVRSQTNVPLFSDESSKRGIALPVKKSDVFVATYPKTGTTLMQQMCHQIRTKAQGKHSTDFEDLYQVSPWVQLAYDLDIDPSAEQVAHPRVFKTHQRLSAMPRGAKYICMVRSPEKALISFFDFLGKKQVIKDPDLSSVTLKGFFSGKGLFGGNIWEFYAEFWRCRELPNVLVLVFEDVVANMEKYVSVVAKFMECELSNEEISRVAQRSSKAYMKANISKFDESWTLQQLKKVGRVKNVHSFLVPVPRVTDGHSHKFNAEAKALLLKEWEKLVPVKSYEIMVEGCRSALQSKGFSI